ncbi:nagb/rpia/CoA transferase-like protein [Dacryopinax primogenitus]|uniref:Translation initiation factor eIF2B subunit alpha n=1 Tax=Dacryopinax primogenitus (strain DJM 731) TaxID=1858805 RepID=M5FPX5_DACPD|nr:nagb/rpia/CoA transferase-like protein [Dacryopinax primogenitus]EJT96624.1 nagb/rpia/CoA transferase-like protein [Dacryopinax primogenitus]
MSPLSESSERPTSSPTQQPFDVLHFYKNLLTDEDLPMPIAAVASLTELVDRSSAQTMSQLVHELQSGADKLKRGTANPISLSAGCDLFVRYVTTTRQEHGDFALYKREIVEQGRAYVNQLPTESRSKISKFALGFIQDDAVILTHSYSRVVMQALLAAHRARKRISVYVTEARPRSLGVKTVASLERAQIPCTLIFDTAVAYIMDKVDLVLVGSEAVVESGGLINAVGTAGLAVIAKDSGRPFYALFLRHFPLNQYDLPYLSKYLPVPAQHPSRGLQTPNALLSRASSIASLAGSAHAVAVPPAPSRDLPRAAMGLLHGTGLANGMTKEQMDQNPEADYTRPELISLVVSDVGILTPQGVSGYLVAVFAD